MPARLAPQSDMGPFVRALLRVTPLIPGVWVNERRMLTWKDLATPTANWSIRVHARNTKSSKAAQGNTDMALGDTGLEPVTPSV